MYIYIYIYICICIYIYIYIYIYISVFDKLIWRTIGPKSFLFGTAQSSVWASGAVNFDYIVTNNNNNNFIVIALLLPPVHGGFRHFE